MMWGLDSVTVRFRARTALDGVTFAAAPSTVTVIVGGDGAGKSTSLKVLVGLLSPEAGTARRPAKHAIGYIPATGGIYPDLTVDENLAFSGTAYGLSGRDLASRASTMVERVGLAGARNRLGGHLSGGMQRKLAVGAALLHEPSLLVLDEPTTGVDPVSRSELWRLISGEAASGTAVVVSTTYVNEAQRASTVVLLDQGRVTVAGSPEQVIADVGGALGAVYSPSQPPGRSWRWGNTWRVWAADGRLPADAEPLQPGLEDAVIIAELSLEPSAAAR